ncbi:5-(carboxyamino)imidazole ribonucleotide synthase [Seinonella peptonophila]|uniref:N5-carboxyaminoimidazole ribonucleotide synthase n=1 Tax=Seinonella peptonophila TaxID=112248 RepID=A0A1M4ZHD1_9BACL|nr:5-(carboxyamino)imidazole ribonucleotide synthase [Seinonella peptonophila]SHF17207.1 5-(carboxyamino)imidazole ribonucleotide synthase [Seinonella peptonophila]
MSKEVSLLPGMTIGVLGGGQLGRMVMLEGRKLGFRFITLDPAEDCPGSQVADDHIVAAYDDLRAAEELAKRSDMVIYEFENIDPSVVKRIETLTTVPQGSELLRVTGHRLHEKQMVSAAGVPVAEYRSVETRTQFSRAWQELGLPVVLKTATGGYDGKGQWMIRTEKDLHTLPDDLFENGQEFVLEQLVPFCKEISVVVARNKQGDIKAFPPTVNLHRNHILHLSLAPAPLSPELLSRAQQLAKQTAEHLQMVGLLAVEMFLLPNGDLLVNELAPRPHNSGHYTFDACSTSQFAQFLRAVLGLPLHEAKLRQPVAMVNLLGEHHAAFEQKFYQFPTDVQIHWYGKTTAKVGRKMGHLTILGDSTQQVMQRVEELGIWSNLTEEERSILFTETAIS